MIDPPIPDPPVRISSVGVDEIVRKLASLRAESITRSAQLAQLRAENQQLRLALAPGHSAPA